MKFFVFFVSISLIHLCESYSTPRIVGGIKAEEGQFPFMVSLGFNNPATTHFCGGSLISDQWVITAAHCTNNLRPSDLQVYLGGIRLSEYENGQVIPVEQIIIHEAYNTSNTIYAINDISLLKLSRSVTFSENILPINLPETNHDTPSGVAAIIMGWGYKEDGQESNDLLYTQLEIITDAECYELNEHDTGPLNICADVPEGGKGQCSGDSGGPLIVDTELVGVVSWSIKPCGSTGHPGVFTQVSYYVNWIKNYVTI